MQTFQMSYYLIDLYKAIGPGSVWVPALAFHIETPPSSDPSYPSGPTAPRGSGCTGILVLFAEAHRSGPALSRVRNL